MSDNTDVRAILKNEGYDDDQVTALLYFAHKDAYAEHVKPKVVLHWLNSSDFNNLEDEQLVALGETHKVVVMEGTLSEDAGTVILSYVVVPKDMVVMEVNVAPEAQESVETPSESTIPE